ncbi:MAG: glucosyltransferase domain-containing protein [Rhodobacteraceae bacterium]|nr:glucosyltransferase domain-containing protein [Paracoccaceae bacterium]
MTAISWRASPQHPAAAFRLPHFLIAALAVYVAVTWIGLTFEGYNSDDWRHLNGFTQTWGDREGRWAMDLIFSDLLGGRFHMPLQIGLAFLCFAAVAWIVAGEAVPGTARPLFAFFIFVIGVNHPYMAGALNFNAHVFAYPLALLLSASGFLILRRAAMGRVWLCLPAVPVAAQCLAFSLAIYQPFALFGAILPILALLRADRYPLGRVVWLFALCALASGLALWLHRVEWQAVMALEGREITFYRFGGSGMDELAARLDSVPRVMRRVLKGELMAPPRPVRMALFAFAALALVLPVAASLADRRGRSVTRYLVDLLRVALASAAAVFGLPILLCLLTVAGELPARALGFMGFWLAAAIAGGTTLGLMAGPSATPQRIVTGAAVTVLVLVAAITAGFSALIWQARAQFSRAELALARQIETAVQAETGYAGQQLRLVGDRQFSEYRWGGSLGVTVFSGDYVPRGMFQSLFGLSKIEENVPASPVACPAFPANGSIFFDEHYVYVCVSAQPALLPLEDCKAASSPEIGTFCRQDTRLVRRLSRCPPPSGLKRTVFAGPPGQGRPLDLDKTFLPFEIEGECYEVIPDWPRDATSIRVTIAEDGKGTVHTETLALR